MQNAMRLVPIALLGSLSACATIVSGSKQPLTVSSLPEGASCEISQRGVPVAVVPHTPGTVRVERSGSTLQVSCTKPGYRPAQTTQFSSVNNWAFADVVAGGPVGVAVDFSTGAAYKYDRDVTLPLEARGHAPQIADRSQRDYDVAYMDLVSDQTVAEEDDQQRYFEATGRSLPAKHGVIILPPTTPNGDPTYIWPTTNDE